MNTTIFAPVSVPDTHFSVTPLAPEDPHFIAIIRVGAVADTSDGRVFTIKMNPTDSRGYRCLVTLTAASSPRSVLNRAFSLLERQRLHAVLALVSHAYTQLGLIAQVEVAGNNSHSFDLATGITTIGASEPCSLHGHVIGRGTPSHFYVENIPLGGPPPGELFDMRQPKQQWNTAEDVAQVATTIRKHLTALLLTEHFDVPVAITCPTRN